MSGNGNGLGSRLGARLLARELISKADLDGALRRSRAQGVRLGELLVSEGRVGEEEVWSELAGIWRHSLVRPEPDPACRDALPARAALRLGVVPLRRRQGVLSVAAIDPTDRRTRREVMCRAGGPVLWFAAPPSAVRQAQLSLWSGELAAAAAETISDPSASARRLLSRAQAVALVAVLLIAVAGLVLGSGQALLAIMALITVGYALAAGFRTLVTLRGARAGPGLRVSEAELRGLRDLPTYTVLCPIYRESSVLGELLRNLQALDYPPALLDVKLLVEADDLESRARLAELRPPPFCQVVVVPPTEPRTKPKACNFGLLLARGEYVVIFDAEDRPAPDQLRKALCVFRRRQRQGGPRLGCVQAQLAFYNARQNWLTGWFALEYLGFFRYFLPGLVSLGYPVPLGGTSNHFPASVLRQVGAWDAFNVTEDADLGVRLHRAGWGTVVMDSVTHEEANGDFVNWARQRSRWGKGYMVTWAVNMRHPLRLLSELGPGGFLALQVTLGVSYLSAVLNSLLWLLLLAWIVGQPAAVAALFPPELYYLAMFELVVGNFFFVYVALWCAVDSRQYGLARLAVGYPAYWVLISIAMAKSGYQLLTDHVYWEKTVHGLASPSSPPESPGPPPAQVMRPTAAGLRPGVD